MSIFYRKHELYPESILIRDFADKVSVENIINSWDTLLEQGMLTSNIKGVINNISGCELAMDLDSFYTLIDYIKSKDVLRSIKLAVVCNNPSMIVFPIMGETEVKELHIKPFSTIEAAVDWIMNG